MVTVSPSGTASVVSGDKPSEEQETLYIGSS